MKNNNRAVAVCFFSVLAAFSSVFAESKAAVSGVERYAVYIGSNFGGKNNERLLYAGTDAMSFQKTMTEIGGVPEENSILLLDPTKEMVDDALSSVSGAIEKERFSSRRTEFIFYYSGHSDECALLLGKQSYDYEMLQKAVSKVPSDVHVVILDSCYSGNFIRTKGGQRKKPFLVDDSAVVKGHAYLSSSSALESSQESDEIGSSFFTNAMITGLRGAADSSGDNKVSLNELYSYAFNDTLSRTESSSAGPQHPNYNITLVGSGDLILSDISTSEAVLVLSEKITGKIIIRDDFGKLISEINKSEENLVYFALPAGTYSIMLITRAETLQGTVSLRKNQLLRLDESSFDTTVARSENRIRGEAASATEDGELSENETKFRPFDFSFVGERAGRTKNLFAVGLIGIRSRWIEGIQLASVFTNADFMSGLQIAGGFNAAGTANGIQVGGLFNTAKTVNGLQVSGVFNLAEAAKGAQVSGVVNVAKKVSGVQIGLINIAEENNGVALGLINIIRNGVHDTGVFIDTNANTFVQFQCGTNHLFTSFMTGSPLSGDDEDAVFLGLGFGSRLNLAKFSFDVEALCFFTICQPVIDLGDSIHDIIKKYHDEGKWFFRDATQADKDAVLDLKNEFGHYFYPSLKFSASYNPFKHLSIFATACFDVCVEGWNDEAFDIGRRNLYIDLSGESADVTIYPAFGLGVRIR